MVYDQCCYSQHLLHKPLSFYGFVFVSPSSSSSSSSNSLLFCFSLRLPPRVYISFPWGNLSPLPPCLLPCSCLLSSQRLIHSTWMYLALLCWGWYSCGIRSMLLQPALATQAASVLWLCLRRFFFLFFLFSSLLLLSQASTSRVHQLPLEHLCPLPPCLLPCSGLLSSQRLIHSTWRYFAWGGTNLVYDQ